MAEEKLLGEDDAPGVEAVEELEELYDLKEAYDDVEEDEESAAGTDGRVITISWWFPLAAVLVLGLGFTIGGCCGRRLSPRRRRSRDPLEMSVGSSVGSSVGQPLPASQPRAFHPLLQQPAPDFNMTLLETGQPVKLSDYRGKPLLINFWATWCPPCRYEMPWLQNAYAAHKDKGFELLAVDAGERVWPGPRAT